MGALSRYLEKRFGMPTRHIVNPLGVASVGTTATKLLNNNPDRLMLLIINLSANVLYVGFESDVSNTKGIYLVSRGGHLVLVADEDGELVGQEIWVVGSDTSTTLYCVVTEAS